MRYPAASIFLRFAAHLHEMRSHFHNQYAFPDKPIAFDLRNILWNKARYGDFY